MILADTSVWVDHLRRRDEALAGLLDKSEILIHPFVIGELALGNLRQRTVVLDTLMLLPSAVVASHQEVLEFIDGNRLSGSGLGYVDVHLLAAACLTADTTLWTRDRTLHSVARHLALATNAISETPRCSPVSAVTAIRPAPASAAGAAGSARRPVRR